MSSATTRFGPDRPRRSISGCSTPSSSPESRAASSERCFALLNQKIGEAQDKGATSVGAFQRIGVTLTDAGGRARRATDILSDIADKMAELSDPADRAALAVALFGRRAGPQLVELLSGGSKAIKELGDDAQRLRIILDQAEVKLGDDMNDALTRFSGAVGATRTRLGLLFAPIFIDSANRLAEAVAALQPQILALRRGRRFPGRAGLPRPGLGPRW